MKIIDQYFATRQINRLPLVLLFLAILIVFGQSLFFKFTLDDSNHISALTSDYWSYFTDFWLQPTWPGNLYRPIFIFTLRLNAFLFGETPFGFHLFNFLLHIIAVILVFKLIKLLSDDNALAFFSSALFAFCVPNIEVISNISYRTESLAAIFSLAALIFYLKFISSGSFLSLVLILLMTIAGILSKESALTLPLLALLLGNYQRNPQNSRRILIAIAAFSIAALLTFATRLWLGSASVDLTLSTLKIDNILIGEPFFERLPRALIFLAKYLYNIFVPQLLFYEYSPGNINLELEWDITNSLALFTILSLFIAAGIAVYQRKLMGLGLAWFFLAFAVTANIILPIGTHYANRLSYFPSIGICYLISYFCLRFFKKSYYLGLILYLCLAASISFVQVSAWENQSKLNRHELSLGSKSARIFYALASEHFSKNDWQKSIDYNLQAIKAYPDFFLSYLQIAKAYTYSGQYQNAREALLRYQSLGGSPEIILQSLAWIELEEGNALQAENSFKKGLIDQPNSQILKLGLYCAYVISGKFKDAEILARELNELTKRDARFQKYSKLIP